MDILLVGGANSLTEAIIDKLNKEGHRVYVLTEKKFQSNASRKVFEYYYFPYESDSLGEVLESVNPEVILCTGAYDTTFDWTDARREAVRYSAGMTNLMTAYAMRKRGRLIYLSSDEVYGDSCPDDIDEDKPVTARGSRAMILAQMEQLCVNYSRQLLMDTIVVRLDHLYYTPRKKSEVTHIAGKLCLDALKTGQMSVSAKNQLSLLHLSDAVEYIYTLATCKEHKRPLYQLSSSEAMNEMELARILQKGLGDDVEIIDNSVGDGYRIVLSNQAFAEEFGIRIRHKPQEELEQMARYMKRYQNVFLASEDNGSFLTRLYRKTSGLVQALIPFAENMVCFIPFFMLNNRSVGSRYFARLDFYLLYVLLFAIVYGQQQATFSAVLATGGYIFRQMYGRTGFEVLLDYNTYIWIAQLFILGLVVGYMKDRMAVLKKESKQETQYLEGQLNDIQDINVSNARMKNVLVSQLVGQTDSLGKVYKITSGLDQYEPEEVLFYAAEIVGNLMGSEDVAIYVVANKAFARLYSATSEQARQLGSSIRYTEMGSLSQAIQDQRVYINKTLDAQYPLMAKAIYVDGEARQIIMVWGIPWERMTLTQADMLTVISYLIQNSALKANQYLQALEDRRYIKDSYVMQEEAFKRLIGAYQRAGRKGLTQYALLRVEVLQEDWKEKTELVKKFLRQSDYLGKYGSDLYALLCNTSEDAAQIVVKRLSENRVTCTIERNLEL